MSEENKKDVEKPQELDEKKSDAHAEAGACTQVTGCGLGNSFTGRGKCGWITRSGCGWQESFSN